jgi:integrase
VARVAKNKTGQEHENRAYEKHLIPFFGRHRMMSAIDAIEIERYKEARLAAGAAPATVNRELEALRRAFTLAVRHGLLPSRPHVERLAEDNVRTGFFEREQFEALLTHLNEVESGKAL